MSVSEFSTASFILLCKNIEAIDLAYNAALNDDSDEILTQYFDIDISEINRLEINTNEINTQSQLNDYRFSVRNLIMQLEHHLDRHMMTTYSRSITFKIYEQKTTDITLEDQTVNEIPTKLRITWLY